MSTFDTASKKGSTTVPSRYATYQALDQEYQKYVTRQRAENRQARYNNGDSSNNEATNKINGANPDLKEKLLKSKAVKRDFFGRFIDKNPADRAESDSTTSFVGPLINPVDDKKVWVSFHEGFSNAVRKPITLKELMKWF